MTRQRRTIRTSFALAVLATMLVGCSSTAEVSSSDNPAEPITPPPVVSVSAVPVEPAATVPVTPAATEPPTTQPPAPTTPAETVPPETTVPAPPVETTVVDPAAGVVDPASTDTVAPVDTVPAEPTTTTIDPYSLLTPAPPPTELIRAIGSLDGDGARAVQQRLLDLRFWLSGVDGDYGHTTRQAVMAFQKYHSLPATGKVDQVTADTMNQLAFMPRAISGEGDLLEINKDMQVLFLVVGGQTQWVLNTSTATGQPYEEPDRNTPGEIQRGVSLTPSGLYQVNRERPDGWWEGDLGKIYRPKYFRGGIAIHGSGSIPNYPASHGCVRVSTQAMDMIWANGLLPVGTGVWVYGSDPAPV
jgi:peptidoglycan hydrolase-like protein with peptidoglycan-binding domain